MERGTNGGNRSFDSSRLDKPGASISHAPSQKGYIGRPPLCLGGLFQKPGVQVNRALFIIISECQPRNSVVVLRRQFSGETFLY